MTTLDRLSRRGLCLGALALTATGCSTLQAPPAVPAGYLFATFKNGGSELSEQIYFGVSTDGRNWQALNRGEPVLISTLGDKGVRDPYLLRRHDGKGFVLIATDLSIHFTRDWRKAVREGSRAIIVWESPDLVTWSAPRRIEVAPADAGCTWAPEAIWDAERGEYMVFWASTTRGDDFSKHRIWAARTKDFRTFGAPFIYIEKPTAVIDTTIVHDGSSYVRFTKDEQFKAITMETSPRLDGPWTNVPDFSLAKMTGYEGPEAYVIEPASGGRPAVWTLILDAYSARTGYAPFVTRDLAKGQFEPGAGFSFPFPFRHGSILPLSAAELERVKAKYGV